MDSLSWCFQWKENVRSRLVLLKQCRKGVLSQNNKNLSLNHLVFITAKQRPHYESQTISSILESVLELETSEFVLEHLLQLIESHRLDMILEWRGTWSTEEVSMCISTLGKLAKTHREDIAVCCVLVHVVEILAAKLKSESEGVLPKILQTFALTLLDHGKC